jgi:hypothetical protein
MADSLISSIRYKDISDDKVDIAVTKLKCPVALIRNRQTNFKFDKRGQLFIRTHNETLSIVAVRVSISETGSLRALFCPERGL